MSAVKNIPPEAIITAFESSYDGFHILDSDGNTLYMNGACTRIEGISKEEAMKKNIRQLVSDGIYSESVTLKVLETKRATTIIQTVKNGNQILATGTPLFNKDGTINSVVVNSRDITDLNNLKKKLSLKGTELERLRLEQGKFKNIIAKSTKMKKVLSLALNVSKVDSTILLTGESGVGKSLLEKFIHDNSLRAEGPFVTVDCSSIPETLLESELFGYEKGAFTGAEKTGKMGLLEMAGGGSVFLDEIGAMPLSMQPKLMRAIQQKEIMPVGGNKLKKLNVRFISATNVDLNKMVKEKLFREDLYYRLNVVPINIPPLRERNEDIVPLVKYLLDKINSRYGFKKQLSPEIHNALIKYQWPGNVRQLENFIERILVSVPDKFIKYGDIPYEMLSPAKDFTFSFDLDSENYRDIISKYDEFVLKTVIAKEGSIPKAADKLKIDPTTIRRKLEKYKKNKSK